MAPRVHSAKTVVAGMVVGPGGASESSLQYAAFRLVEEVSDFRAPSAPQMAGPEMIVNQGLGTLQIWRYRDSGLVVCPACSYAWGCKSPVQPDGGEGRVKHKGVIARWRLKEVRSRAAT